MAVLLELGHWQSAVARLLGVSEGAVRYHRKRWSAGAGDGRSKQELKAAAHAEAMAHWRAQQADGRINQAALYYWLRREHGYDGSLKSVQRYTDRLILRDERHYEGEDTERVRAPMPLGRMGRRPAQIAAGSVQHGSIELHARLAEVAR